MSADDVPQRQNYDAAFKDLILSRPRDMLSWLLPDAEEQWGDLQTCKPLRQEPPRQTLDDSSRILDLPLLCHYENGDAIICVIEHQRDKNAFSIYRLCHYTLDMKEQYPELPVVPIVIFADEAREWRTEPQFEIVNEAFGTTWLEFRFHWQRLKGYKARDMIERDNPVFYVLSMCFDYEPDEAVELLVQAIRGMYHSMPIPEARRFLTFLDICAKLSSDKRTELTTTLREDEEPEMGGVIEALEEVAMERGLKKGREEGRREGAIAQVRLCEKLLKRPEAPLEELEAMPLAELQALANGLERDALD